MKGTVTDLTIAGCRLRTLAPIPINTYLELWLYMSSMAQRIVIELAAVRWVSNGQLGIEFLGLQPEQRAQLQQFAEPPSSMEGPSQNT